MKTEFQMSITMCLPSRILITTCVILVGTLIFNVLSTSTDAGGSCMCEGVSCVAATGAVVGVSTTLERLGISYGAGGPIALLMSSSMENCSRW
jgi:hypothetical protein